MNSDMAKAILAKVQEKKAKDPYFEIGGFKIGPRTADGERLADLPMPYRQVNRDSGGIFAKGDKTQGKSLSELYPGVTKTISELPSNVYDLFAKPFNHVTKSVGDYFTRNPVEQQIAELAKKRIDSIGGAEQADMARRVLLGSLGVGLGAGGLYALYKALNRPKLPKRDDEEVALQYPVERTKAAGSSWLESLLGKQQNPSVWDNPLFIPGLTLGGLGAVYAGLRGSTYLADKLADKARKDELAKAKREFHDALISGYSEPLKHDPLHGSEKLSSDNTMTKLSETLDSLYDACFEKKALDWTAGGLIPTTIAAALPTYLTLGSLAGLGAGSMAYDATKKHSKAEALKKALRERARLKYEQSPPELYISPEAIDVSELKKQRSSVV